MELFFTSITDYFSGLAGQLELAATVLLIANVYLLAKQKLLNYAFGLVGVLVMGYVFMSAKLYSDMMLQWVFYAPLQIVGYVMWKYGKTLGGVAKDTLDSMKIVTISTKARIVVGSVILVSAVLVGYIMSSFTDAAVPYVDALTTTMSIAASILLLKKIWENWIIWIAMDLIAIPLYYSRELYVISGLYIIFLGLATYGALTWYKELKK
jgi:nicotinamide mononucleotide transporter